jgi:hypothetical protein
MPQCVDCLKLGVVNTEKIFNNRCPEHREEFRQVHGVTAPTFFIQTKLTPEMLDEAKLQLDAYNDLLRRSLYVVPDDQYEGKAGKRLTAEEMAERQAQQLAHNDSVKAWREWKNTPEPKRGPKPPFVYLPRIFYRGPLAVARDWKKHWLGMLGSDTCAAIAQDLIKAWKRQYEGGGQPGRRQELTLRLRLHRSGGYARASFEKYIQNSSGTQTELRLDGYTFLVRQHRPFYPYQEWLPTKIKNIYVDLDIPDTAREGDIISGSLSLQQEYVRAPFDENGSHAVVDLNYRKAGTEGEWASVLILETGEYIEYMIPISVRFASDRARGRIDVPKCKQLSAEVSAARNEKRWDDYRALKHEMSEWRSKIARVTRWRAREFASLLWKKNVRVVFFENLDVKGMNEDRANKKGKGKPKILREAQKYRQIFMPPGLLRDCTEQIFDRGSGGSRGAVEFIENYRGTSSTCCIHGLPVAGEKMEKVLTYKCGCVRDRSINAVYSLAGRARTEFSQTYPRLPQLVDLRISELQRSEQVAGNRQVAESVAESPLRP